MDYDDPFPYRELSKSFMIANSLNYFPEYYSLSNIIDLDNKNRINNTGDYSMAYKYDKLDISAIKIKATLQAKSTKRFMMSGKMLDRYLRGTGNRYDFKADELVDGSINAKAHYNKNLARLMRACKQSLKKGRTQYIATATIPEHSFVGTDYENTSLLNIPVGAIIEFDKFTSLGSCNAGMICKCTYDGEYYSVSGTYYLMDYYDWAKKIDIPIGLVSPSQLYKLNLTGDARNFEIRGSKKFEFKFK